MYLLYGIFTYTLDYKVSCVHKKGFYGTIISTVRYFLHFYGTGNIVKYKKWCCMYIRFVLYSTVFCTFFKKKKRYFVYKKIGKQFMVFTVFYCFVL